MLDFSKSKSRICGLDIMHTACIVDGNQLHIHDIRQNRDHVVSRKKIARECYSWQFLSLLTIKAQPKPKSMLSYSIS